MIISRKKLNEKIAEAIERVEIERWMHDKIDRVERECNERIEGLLRHLCDLEQKIARLMGEEKG